MVADLTARLQHRGWRITPQRRAVIDALAGQGAQAILNLSASPFTIGKAARRAEMMGILARKHRLPIFYCNAVGGNDQLIFDGNSLAINAEWALQARLAPFAEDLAIVDFDPDSPARARHPA